MCQFFSGIITNKNKQVLWDYDFDSHTALLEKHGIKDDSTDPNFVRVEFLPPGGDVFNHDLAKWKLQVDQDFRPDWFDQEKSTNLMRKALEKIIKERFIINRAVNEIREGRWFVGNGGTINAFRGGTIEYVRGGTINAVYGGTIEAVLGGTIEYVHGGTIKAVWSGTIEAVLGGTIEYVHGGTIKAVWSGTIEAVLGGTIEYVRGGTIEKRRLLWKKQNSIST